MIGPAPIARLGGATLFVVLLLTACQAPEDRVRADLRQALEDGRLSGAYSLSLDGQAAERVLSPGVAAESRFRIASLTKVFTQLAVLRLVGQGALDLDQSLASARPGFDAGWAETVTLRQLLNFSSGLPREIGGEEEGVRLDPNGGGLAFMNSMTTPAPENEPGRRQRYSNLGYFHLGAVIEAATGQPYAEAVETLVIRPAGLTDTGFGVDRLGEQGHLRGYAEGVEVSNHPVSHRYASGGMHASIADLERLSAAILTDEFLRSGSGDELFTQFGRPEAADPGFFLAGGHVPGFAHAWVISREPEFILISLNNRIDAQPRRIPDMMSAAAAALGADIADGGERYRPSVRDGWTMIDRLEAVGEHPVRARLIETVRALQSGEAGPARDTLMRLHGLDPDSAPASERADFQDIADAYLSIFDRFGPFHAVAWRMDGRRLQIYLDSEDGRRGLHVAAEPEPDSPGVADSVGVGTYGFYPN